MTKSRIGRVLILPFLIFFAGKNTRFAIADSPEVKWVLPFQSFTAPTIGLDGAIYLGTGNSIYSIAQNGTVNWRADGTGHLTTLRDGRILATSSEIWAYEPLTGEHQMLLSLPSPLIPPAYDEENNRIYSVDSTGALTCINIGLRNVEWKLRTFSGNPISYDSHSKLVLVSEPSGDLSAVDVSSRIVKWRFTQGAGEPNSFTSATDGAGTIYFTRGNSLFAIESASGTAKWTYTEGPAVASPIVGGQSIYLITSSNLVALSTDGQVQWRRISPGAGGTPLLAQDGTLYYAQRLSTSMNVIGVDSSNGMKKWVYANDFFISYFFLSIGRDGTLLLPGENLLRALSTFSPLAETAWPKEGRDYGNSWAASGKPPPVAPSFRVPLADQTSFAGDSVTFAVQVNGSEPMLKEWYFNGQRIQNATNLNLTLTNVTVKNQGRYSIIVRNDRGAIESEAFLIVNARFINVTTTSGTNVANYVDSAVGALARFNQPNGLAYFGSGLIAVADGWNHAIRLVDVNGAVATLAGDNVPGYVDAPGTAARFNFPLSLNMDRNGDVLVTDTENNAIRRVNVFGLRNVTTVAGDGVRGYKDGTALEAEFNFPNDVAVSTNGFIYVSEYSNHTVRVIAPNGVVSTLAGNGTRGYQDGTGTQARFNQPGGLTIGADGNIYITEWVGNRIRRITPEGVVTTVAGTNVAGFKDGQGGEAQFNVPDGIAADPYGNLYVSEDGNHAIRKIDPQGNVTTIAGLGTPGFKDGDRTTAMFNAPGGIMWHPSGSLYVSDTLNHSIRKVSFLQTTNSESAELLIEMNPSVTVFGDAGKTYRIEAAEETSPLTWVGVGNVTLTNGAQQWFDPQPAGRAKRFYRAVKVN